MPEFLKHFIVANSAVLFSLTLVAASVGIWTMSKMLLRFIRGRPDREPGDSAERIHAESSLADALLATNRRLDQLEALIGFDRELGRARMQHPGR